MVLEAHQVAPDRFRPLARHEYEALVRLGAFEDERVELLYGSVIEMSPHGPRHDATIDRLLDVLRERLGDRARVRVQSAFVASDGSEPQPDLSVVSRRDYDEGHPKEAFLLIEVADTSVAKDRTVKAKLYAECGVEEYWLVNLVDRVVEVFTRPEGGGYMERRVAGPDAEIRIHAFRDVVVEVAAFLK